MSDKIELSPMKEKIAVDAFGIEIAKANKSWIERELKREDKKLTIMLGDKESVSVDADGVDSVSFNCHTPMYRIKIMKNTIVLKGVEEGI